jgi:IMP dehydrogenase
MDRRMELVMALMQGLSGIREAYTFDDVLLRPGLSDILPSEADIRSHVTRAIPLNIPIIASTMDTVT